VNDNVHSVPETNPGGRLDRDPNILPMTTISVLGQMRVTDAGGADVLPRGRKARAMLAILALEGPGPVLRERLCQLLWSRRHRDQARASLRQSIHELQEGLARAGSRVLTVERGMLCLNRDMFNLDIDPFAPHIALDWPLVDRQAATHLARAQLLEDLVGVDPAFDQWVQEQQRRINRQITLRAEAVLAHPDDKSFAPEKRTAAAAYLIELFPSHSTAGRALVAEHISRGERNLNAPASTSVNASPDTTYRASYGGARFDADRVVRLGVLPFRALDEGALDGLAAGMADEITAALSRFRWFFLVASPSLAALATEIREGSDRWRMLDLDFLVEGTVRRSGERVRVSARLLDLRVGGEVVWAGRFDRLGRDAMTLQDEIAAQMVAQIDPQLLLHEARRATISPATSLSAYQLVLGTVPALYHLDQASFVAAGAPLEAAVKLDPHYAGAYAWWAYWHVFMVGQGWADDHTGWLERAGTLAERAVALDPCDARGLAIAGHVRDMQNLPTNDAAALHERALALNPNLPLAWGFAGLSQSLHGYHVEALRMIEQAQSLSPFDPHGFYFEMLLMMPNLLLRNFNAVVELGRRAILLNPSLSSSFKGLLSALGHLGMLEEAASIRARLAVLEPAYTLRTAEARAAIRGPEDRALFLEGLRLGGLPA